MSYRIRAADIYVDDTSGGAIVVGHEFGPCLLFVGRDVYGALSEFDERHGQRVDLTDPALADCGGLEGALSEGEVRFNDGGTLVWVSPYEWVREFRTVRDAGRFWRGA